MTSLHFKIFFPADTKLDNSIWFIYASCKDPTHLCVLHSPALVIQNIFCLYMNILLYEYDIRRRRGEAYLKSGFKSVWGQKQRQFLVFLFPLAGSTAMRRKQLNDKTA